MQYQVGQQIPPDVLEDWRSKPLNGLTEHLTANHKAFREHDLDHIDRLLSLLQLELGLVPAPAMQAHSDFRTFRREFTWHMEEEESFLFPKILRTEACLHDPELYPETFKGSVGIFSDAQIHLPEETFRDLLATLTQKVRALPFDPVRSGTMKEILVLLEAFGARLKAHTYLESEILFPWTAEMEAVLRKRAAKEML